MYRGAMAPYGPGIKPRLIIKAAVALVLLAYCSLLVYQSGVPSNFQETRAALQIVQPEPVTSSVVESVDQNKNITLDDVFISVKTTKHYEVSRLPIILKTWFQLAKNQTWFFTDVDNEQLQNLTNGHMVNTKCSATHQRKHLCCKTAVEYDYFLASGKKWFCHFDDDNYVNVPRLVAILQRYNHQEDWYLGRTSVYEPVKIYKRKKLKFAFWFATGGAGYCISKSLALKMSPVASGGRFISVCEKIKLPDDVSMGYIIEKLMKKNLTLIPEFHSHYETMQLLRPETLKDQISLSFSNKNGFWNVVTVPGFNVQYDPTRFLSVHCFLFPHSEFCPR